MKKLILLMLLAFSPAIGQFINFPPWYTGKAVRYPGMHRNSSAVAVDTTKFYLSATGSDLANGHSSSTPWQTITKLNTATLEPGDQVLLHSGDTLSGQINISQSGTSGSPITITSYGTGSKPIIKGSETLGPWVQNGLIWACKRPDSVKNLYVSGVQMIRARKPNVNSGFYVINGTNGSTNLTSASLTEATGYWIGATLRIRSINWYYEARTVSGWNGTTLTFPALATTMTNVAWGFYMENLKALLDTTNEWFCATDSFYYQPASGINPNTLTIEGVTKDYGISLAKDYVTIQNLDFQKQTLAGISVTGNGRESIKILSNNISDQWTHGIALMGVTPKRFLIDGNTITRVNGCAISAETMDSSKVSNNTITHIGLIPGYGAGTYPASSFVGDNSGIWIQPPSIRDTILANTIDSVGYQGMSLEGSYHLIKNNVVTNVMRTMADGGGIYLYAADHSIVRGNIVHDSYGGTGTGSPVVTTANGIYLDDGYTHDILVDSNTVYNIGSQGVRIQTGDTANTIRANTFFNCATDGAGNITKAFATIAQDSTGRYGGHTITKNIFYPRIASKYLIRLDETDGGFAIHPFAAVMDTNYYCNPLADVKQFASLIWKDPWTDVTYSLAQWRTLWTQDSHSLDMYEPLLGKGDSLFVNATGAAVSFTLANNWRDLDGAAVTSPLSLGAYSSKVLINDPTTTPRVTTVAASSVLATSATVNGTVNSHGFSAVVKFIYGTSTGVYTDTVTATESPATGLTRITVSKGLTGLAGSTEYFYKVLATSSEGATLGSELNFTTPAAAIYVINGATLNGNFEAGAANWAAYSEGTSTATVGDATSPHAGTKDGKLFIDATEDVCQMSQNALSVGTVYSFSLYAIASGSCGITIACGTATKDFTLTTGWQNLTGTLTCATNGYFNIKRNWGGGVTFYVDDVQVWH